eukprot:scaffold61562_cov60-Phaeocystis_antarctica.AAC.4
MDSWVSRATRLARYTVPRCWVPHNPNPNPNQAHARLTQPETDAVHAEPPGAAPDGIEAEAEAEAEGEAEAVAEAEGEAEAGAVAE